MCADLADPPTGHAGELAEALAMEGAPNGVMDSTRLDGFLTGIALAPHPIAPSEWLPVAMGSATVDDSAANVRLFSVLMARYNAILGCARGAGDAPLVPYIGETAEGGLAMADWAAGFFEAMQLRPAAWQELVADPQWREVLLPIVRFMALDDDDAAADGAPEPGDDADAREAAAMLPRVVPIVYRYWQQGGETAPATRGGAPARRRKVGRNDPCPCGSGRKAKRCCGAG